MSKFVYGKMWERLPFDRFCENCRLLLEYHRYECPDNVDWKDLYRRMCVCDAVHYIMGDLGDKLKLPDPRPERLEARIYEGVRI